MLHPNRRCIIWLDQNKKVVYDWAYHEFYEYIQNVAHYLDVDVGIKQGDRVVLCFMPSLEFYVAFWATLAIGAIAVPVCPIDVRIYGYTICY